MASGVGLSDLAALTSQSGEGLEAGCSGQPGEWVVADRSSLHWAISGADIDPRVGRTSHGRRPHGAQAVPGEACLSHFHIRADQHPSAWSPYVSLSSSLSSTPSVVEALLTSPAERLPARLPGVDPTQGPDQDAV